MTKKQPNCFIIGAPKCGTTALASYLNDHENIFVSDPKEPHYFATDLPGYDACKSKKNYEQIFMKVNNKHKIICEASVFYLYSKNAIKNIYEYNKNAKIIIMLRNPVDMVYSLHAQLFYTADEDEKDFTKAWNLIEKRKKGINIPKYTRAKELLYYDEIAKYAEQLERVYKYFNHDNVKIIFFNDFKEDTKKVYEDVLNFLDLEQNNKSSFPIINENEVAKNNYLKTLIKKQPLGLKILNKGLKKIIKVKSFGLVRFINKLNSKKEKRKALPNTLRQDIINTYKSDIHLLSKLTGRNLDKWLN